MTGYRGQLRVGRTEFYFGTNGESRWYTSRAKGFFEIHAGRLFAGFVN